MTILAVAVWRQLGRDAARAIAIGVGAGTLEAFLLVAAAIVAVAVAVSGLPEAAETREQIAKAAERVEWFWLIGPVERALTLLIHASTRALVLLGLVHKKPGMVWSGFAIFTAVDGIAGGAVVSLKTGAAFSLWWIELAIAPLSLLSVFILRWCYQRWPTQSAIGATSS